MAAETLRIGIMGNSSGRSRSRWGGKRAGLLGQLAGQFTINESLLSTWYHAGITELSANSESGSGSLVIDEAFRAYTVSAYNLRCKDHPALPPRVSKHSKCSLDIGWQYIERDEL